MLHCGVLSAWLHGSYSGRSLWYCSTLFHMITLSWSDIGYYHMVWMAVSLKIILCSSYFISMFSDFSDTFVFRRGSSLRWISKILIQLIISQSSGLFFLQSIIAYVVLVCCRDWNSVIQIRKLGYFLYLSMYVLSFMCDCLILINNTFILLWHYIWTYIS